MPTSEDFDQLRQPMIACDECDALNPEGASFCEECGVKLVVRPAVAATQPPPMPAPRVEPPPLPQAAGRRRRADPETVERARARNEFGRIKNIVFTVRSVYWAGVVFALVQVLIYHVILMPLGVGYVVAAVCWGQLGLMVAGALLVVRSPWLWTVVGACYWTLNTLGILWVSWQTDWVLMQDARVTAFVTMLVFTVVCFWFATAQAGRVQRLMREHPELQIVRKKLDPERRVEGGVADDVRLRRLETRHREQLALLRRIGIVAAGLAVVGVVLWLVTRPEAVGDTVATFRERWANGDGEGLGDLFVDGPNGVYAGRLQKAMAQRGWQTSPPAIELLDLDEEPDAAMARFSSDAGEVSATFQRESVGWRLHAVTLPALVPGAIEPAIVAFRKAWQASGTDELVALFRPESRERAGRQLVQLLERRSWHEQRPALAEVDPGRPGRPRVRVLFAYGFDEVGVVFEYWHPQWWMTSVSLPKE